MTVINTVGVVISNNQNLNLRVETPRIPNFIRLKADGVDVMIPVADCTDTQLEQIGQSWTKKLIELASKRRAQKRG